jgi:hypothetical protein
MYALDTEEFQDDADLTRCFSLNGEASITCSLAFTIQNLYPDEPN